MTPISPSALDAVAVAVDLRARVSRLLADVIRSVEVDPATGRYALTTSPAALLARHQPPEHTDR